MRRHCVRPALDHFDEELQDKILDATYEVLKPGGRFATFSYVTSPLMRSGRKFIFEKLPQKFAVRPHAKNIWNNSPPATVYTATKR